MLSDSYGSEAMLHYSDDSETLLTIEGVHIAVKPEENCPWTTFNHLSLGQQSQVLACLSLSCCEIEQVRPSKYNVNLLRMLLDSSLLSCTLGHRCRFDYCNTQATIAVL